MKDVLGLVKRWAREVGMEVIDVADPRTHFHLMVKEPRLPSVDIVHLRMDDTYLLLTSSISVNEEHQEKLLKFDKKSQDEFLWKIRMKLVSMNIEFRWEGGDGPPTMWRIFSRLYLDKASVQDFWQAYLNVKNASLFLAWSYQSSF